MKKYGPLQKNLEELESLIRSIFSEEEGADPDPDGGRQRYMAAAEEIKRRVAFLKSQMAAELSSHDPDHHLSHLSRRFGNIHSVLIALNNNLLHGEPLHSPHLDAPSSCSCSDDDDDESCCLHEGLDDGEVDGGLGSFTVYDNPLSLSLDEDENENAGVKREEEEEDGDDSNDIDRVKEEDDEEEEQVGERIEKVAWWCHWRPMLIGVVAGGLTVAATLLSLVTRYGLECRFGDYYSHISVFPPPT